MNNKSNEENIKAIVYQVRTVNTNKEAEDFIAALLKTTREQVLEECIELFNEFDTVTLNRVLKEWGSTKDSFISARMLLGYLEDKMQNKLDKTKQI